MGKIELDQLGATQNQTSSTTAVTGDVLTGLDQIGSLTSGLTRHLHKTLKEIREINLQTQLLSLNAQIEAAHAGKLGAAFSVVAEEMAHLSKRTSTTAGNMEGETDQFTSGMQKIIDDVGVVMRGTRLSDLALTNIELVDRNLYERSCDVRWWATDSSVVEALERADVESSRHTCHRLGIILDSYTVYYDLVVCDLTGTVVANGRPEQFASIGSNQRGTQWFSRAIETTDGTQFGFQSVHRSPTLAGGKYVLVYSCAIRSGGDVKAEPIGVLGIIFNWESLAQTIVRNTQIGEAERKQTRVCLTDDQGLVLADTAERLIAETLALPDQTKLFTKPKTYQVMNLAGKPHLVAHASAPGYETYSTGWHSLILQPLDCN